MGRIDFRPARVRHTAAAWLAARGNHAAHAPAWYRATGDVPAPEILTRTLPVRHDGPSRPRPGRRNVRKASKLFTPQWISYEEDGLRTEFFKDHPWELARPRLVIEEDGKDYQLWDWSKAYEAGRPVGGESVIQRQRHLMREAIQALTDEELAKLDESATQAERNRASDRACERARDQSYDQARKELYLVRHDHEIELRVAREEALAMGAYFGKTTQEVGMELENRTFDHWRKWAEEEAVVLEQSRASAYGGSGQGAATLVDDADMLPPTEGETTSAA